MTRRGVPAVALRCGLAAALGCSLATAPHATASGPRRQARDELPVKIAVEALSPVLVPDDGATLRVSGRITNTGDETVRVRVRLQLGNPVTSRSALAEGPQAGFGGVQLGDTLRLGDLGGHAVDSAPFTFELPVAELPLDDDSAHVYRLRIEVRDARGVRVGATDTFLPWWPVTTARTRLAWVWPLIEPSHRALGTDFFDAGLVELLGADGRLGVLLDVAADVADRTPVTWAVDPELIDSVDLLTRGYTVDSERPAAVTPGGDPVAAAWLDRARTALRQGALLALPYGDPDLAALAGTPLAPDVANAGRLGADRLATLLGTSGDRGLAWPPEGELDLRVQDLLLGGGARGIVVAESSLPLAEPLNFTPTAGYPLQGGAVGGATALVADAALAGLVATGPGDVGRRLAVQRFLAETAMITLERPSDPRTVVVTPPRHWDPDPAYARQLLTTTATVPWLTPVTLPDALREPVTSVARTLRPAPVTGALPPTYVANVVAARRAYARYRSVLTVAGDLPALLDNALLRAESTGWRDRPQLGRRLAATVTDAVADEFAKLQVATGGIVTLAGTSGKIPVTIINDLGQPVRIRVRIETRGRLLLDDECYNRCSPVTIAPGRATLVVPGRAVTSGVFPIYVELLPPGPDDVPLRPRATLRVRSKNYGVLALAITGGAFALLLVASVVRLVRRRRDGGAAGGATDGATP